MEDFFTQLFNYVYAIVDMSATNCAEEWVNEASYFMAYGWEEEHDDGC